MARRSGLGKGLGALIPSEVVEADDGILREVPIGSITPNTFQPREHFDEEALSSLAASIREIGVLQPILVRPSGDEDGTYELIAGERRWRAARRAGLSTIPVLIRASTDDKGSLEQALVENLHRADLNALEEAAAYQQLIDDFDLTHEEVATRVGKSRASVTNTLRLLQLPSGVQRALQEGQISAGHARALLGTPDRSLQEELAVLVVAEGLSVRATEELVRNGGVPEGVSGEPSEDGEVGDAVPGPRQPEPRRTAPRPLPPPGILELEELLSSHLDTRVKVDLSAKRGRLLVEFATLEDLERIYRQILGSQRPGNPV
jgi:ParB family transcriptional regulator, chromosome partitioning protein